MIALKRQMSPHLTHLPASLNHLKINRNFLAASIICSLLVISLFHTVPSHSRFGISVSDLPPNVRAIYNRTLGFQKIYALVLPDRKDRVIPMLEAANATNVTITVLNAVRDAEISKEQWPTNWKENAHQKGELGCVASHVRTWKKMIEQNITSAIVLESDADWDLRIHDIFALFPPAVHALTDFATWNRFSPRKDYPPTPDRPYGLNWDVLWMGHCGSNAEGAARVYSWNDTTVPPDNKQFIFDVGLSSDQKIPGTRAIFQFSRTTCSTGYAISLMGARKLVRYFNEADANLDLQLSHLCTHHADLICLGVWPQVFTPANSASNIDHTGNGDVVGGKPSIDSDLPPAGPGLQFSARANAKAVGKGHEKADWKAEWNTMWAPVGPKAEEKKDEGETQGVEREEEGKHGLENGRWIEVPLNRTQAFLSFGG